MRKCRGQTKRLALLVEVAVLLAGSATLEALDGVSANRLW